MDETKPADELQIVQDDVTDPAPEPEEITPEEVRRSLEKLLPRYEQMLRNLAE